MFKPIISNLFLAGLAGVTGNAFAGPSEDAGAHLRAIASGDVQAAMAAYGDNARLVLTFRNGKVIAETWQVDPALAVAAAK